MEQIILFDIDGVITHPHIKKPNDAILTFIASKLHKKPVALVTGRATGWMQREIIPLVKEKLENDTDIDNLFISGEKGGVWIEFSNGVARPFIDKTIAFPRDVAKQIYLHIQGKKGIFFDRDKYTMVSIEIIGGEDTGKIYEQKKILQEVLEWTQKTILPNFPELVVEPSEISIDLLVKGIDKRVSVKQFLTFLEKKHIPAQSFIMFGDSPSDTLVPQELLAMGKEVTFMYVGKEPLTKTYNFPIITGQTGFYDTAVIELIKNYVDKKK